MTEEIDTTIENDDVSLDDLLGESEEPTEPVDTEEPAEEPSEETPDDKRLTALDKKVARAEKRYEKLQGDIRDSLKERKEVSPPVDDKEKQAQDFIRKEAEKVIEERETAQKEAASAKADQLAEEMDSVLDENPDLKKDKILDIIEDFAKDGQIITPTVAAKILERTPAKEVEKPKMPTAKRTATDVETSKAEDKTDGMSFQQKMAHAQQAAVKQLRKL